MCGRCAELGFRESDFETPLDRSVKALRPGYKGFELLFFRAVEEDTQRRLDEAAESKISALPKSSLARSSDLVAEVVFDALTKWPGETRPEEFQVFPTDPLTSTQEIISRHNIPTDRSATTLIGKVRGDGPYVAMAVPSGNHAELGLVREHLDVNGVSLVLEEFIPGVTGRLGTISPFGLPGNMPFFVDKDLVKKKKIIVASGRPDSRIVTPGRALGEARNAIVVSGLGQAPIPVRVR